VATGISLMNPKDLLGGGDWGGGREENFYTQQPATWLPDCKH